MTNLRRLGLLMLGAASIILLTYSCAKKEAETIQEEATENLPYYPQVGSFRSLTMPGVESGMLKFNDQQHFEDYLDYLDAIVMDEPQSESEEDTDPTSIDDKLLAVEQSLGFNSLRAKLQADFEALDAVGFESLDDIPEEYYIASSSYRSVFNEHQEVQIGEEIYVYYNENTIVKITDASIDTRNEVRQVRTANPDDVPTYYRVSWNNVIVLPTVLNGTRTVGKGGTGAPKCNNGSRYLQPIEFEPDFDPCQPLTRYYHFTSGITCFSGGTNDPWNSPIEVFIDWGDGSPVETEVINNGEGRNDPANNSIRHDYPQIGQYNMSVTGILVDDNSPLSPNPGGILVDILGTCMPDEYNSGRIWDYSNETGSQQRAYSSEFLKNNLIGGSRAKGRLCAITKSYEWRNGKWRSVRVNRLHSSFNSNHRGDATDCNVYYTQTKAVWPFNSKKAEAVGTEKYHHMQDGDASSNHRMYYNSNMYQQSFVLDVPDC